MSEIKIEKGVPLTNNKGGPGKYPWAKMEVGDSFLFKGVTPNTAYRVSAMQSKNGKKFTTRKTPEGFRCWRVA